MPAAYAHSRFGGQAMTALGGEALRIVRGYPDLYRVGLQGPDPLFYYNPFWKNAFSSLASAFHKIPGRELFSRGETSEAEQAYLFGLLCHYCLDSTCHPFVNGLADAGECGHTELETEFDRFLMVSDGVTAPHTRNLGAELHLTAEECAQAARFYPPATAKQFRRSLGNMGICTRILSGNTILKRPFLEWILPKLGGGISQHLMPTEPNPRVCHLNKTFLSHYDAALERFPSLARQLEDHLLQGKPLGEDFAPIMG